MDKQPMLGDEDLQRCTAQVEAMAAELSDEDTLHPETAAAWDAFVCACAKVLLWQSRRWAGEHSLQEWSEFTGFTDRVPRLKKRWHVEVDEMPDGVEKWVMKDLLGLLEDGFITTAVRGPAS
jgi:hypothetical protein